MSGKKRERILLVDDDGEVRSCVSEFLEFEGYEVLQEAGGEGGFETYCQQSPFVFVLSDFQFIPGKKVSSCGSVIRNGADLLREIRLLAPDQRMALMTGDPKAAYEAMESPIRNVLVFRKPFSMHELIAVIRKA